MTALIDDDPYDPSDQEIAEANVIFARLKRHGEEIDSRAALRKKNRGPANAVSGTWRDNPKGAAHWKAEIAGLAEAYADVTGKRGDARDQVAQAAGVANLATAQGVATRPANAIGAASSGRPYSPGDASKSVRDFIKLAKSSKDPTVQRSYRNARKGVLILYFAKTHVGRQGPLSKDNWIVRPRDWPSQPCELSLVEAIQRARKTKLKYDIDIACSLILAAAASYGEGRWLFHGKRRPRTTSA